MLVAGVGPEDGGLAEAPKHTDELDVDLVGQSALHVGRYLQGFDCSTL